MRFHFPGVPAQVVQQRALLLRDRGEQVLAEEFNAGIADVTEACQRQGLRLTQARVATFRAATGPLPTGPTLPAPTPAEPLPAGPTLPAPTPAEHLRPDPIK